MGLPIGATDAIALEFAGSTGSAGSTESTSAVWTWGDLAEAAESLSEQLAAIRVGPTRPRIGQVFDLSPAAVVAVHGIARSGAILAPGHATWDASQVERWVYGVEPDAVLVSAGLEWPGDWRRESVPLPGFGTVDLLLPAGPDRDTGGPSPGGARRGTPAGTDVMISTSGSGGAPRTVCHSWAALRANARASNDRAECGADSVTLATLAWGHVGGLAIIVRTAECGGRIVCGPSRFDAGDVAEALVRHRVTDLSVVPVMLDRLLETGLPAPPTLRRVLAGGAATTPSLLSRAVEAGWPVALTYGLTEAGSQVATTTPAEAARGVGALDRPLEGVEIRLADGGEILVRGPSMLLGYLEGAPALDEEGWFATGDFAAPDGAGSLRVTGRRSSRIVTGGTNVDAEEIEAVLREHESIDEVCVVGVPDERWGEVVTAVVAPGPGASRGLADVLDAWARERLAGPRRPRAWRIVDRLPRTPSGKIDRVAIRAGAGRGHADGHADEDGGAG